MITIIAARKIMSECFDESGTENIIFVPVGSRQGWFEKILPEMNEIDRLKCRSWAINSSPDSYVLSLYIKGVSKGKNPDDYFKLRFRECNGVEGLWISDAKKRRAKTKLKPFPVTDLSQVKDFVEAIKSLQERNHLLSQRKQKVASLQQTGLTARLKELGKEHNFAFAMSENVRDVRLSIRIDGRKSGFHFTFPKGKLGAVLDQVPDLINTLENLQSLSVQFQKETRNWKAHHRGKWIKPPSGLKIKSSKMKNKKSSN